MELSKPRQALVDAFKAALHEDTLPWQQCWRASRPISVQTGKEYRGVNNLTLSFAAHLKGYTDPRWVTYKQALDRGWQVRRGEKSSRVEFWHYYDKQAGKVIDQSEVRRIQREQPERMKYIRLAAYSYAVFNAQQVDGVPQLPPQEAKVDVARLKHGRDLLLHNLGVEFREGGSEAYYLPRTDSIHMPHAECFTSDYAYTCILLHEAGHATGHESRLNRDMGAPFGSPTYAREELRAEIASAFLSQSLGLKLDEQELKHHTDQHKAYIQSWISALDKDPNELFAAIKDADKIADYLMEKGRLLELGMSAESSRLQAQAPQPQPEASAEWEP